MRFDGDPIQFESALKLLCERMGLSVQLTKCSHDGGVDLVVDDPTPIRGGRFIVQAKRYEGAVGEPVIRDLYGTLIHEGVVKALLITTGHFTPAAVAFAKGKPIELLDGEILEKLIFQYQLGWAFFPDPASPGSPGSSGAFKVDELEEQRKHFKSLLVELRDDLLNSAGGDSPYARLALAGFLRQPGNISFKDAALQEVEAALDRIEKDTYGVCESCGKRISIGRLGALPQTRFCLECQMQSEEPLQ